MTKTRILVVDDQLMARQLFEMYIGADAKYELAGSVASASYAEAFVQQVDVDMVIMDILMNDGSNGLDAAEKIKKVRPNIKIVAVTSMVEASWLKETIIEVLDRTIAGESVYPDEPPKVRLGLANSEEFTDRELAVLRLMTTGMSNAKIAQKLDITQNTVKTHIMHMLDKTGCSNRTELAIEARVRGIVVNID